VNGSRFRGVNARDRNFTPVTIRRRMDQVDASIQRYLGILDTAGKRRGCPRFLENATRSDLLPKIMPLGNLLVRWRRVMRRGRFAGDWIIGALREYEVAVKTAELCRKHGISDATFYNWKAKYGAMTVSEAAWLRALEDKNRRLKDLLGKN
jgi:putative transposase